MCDLPQNTQGTMPLCLAQHHASIAQSTNREDFRASSILPFFWRSLYVWRTFLRLSHSLGRCVYGDVHPHRNILESVGTSQESRAPSWASPAGSCVVSRLHLEAGLGSRQCLLSRAQVPDWFGCGLVVVLFLVPTRAVYKRLLVLHPEMIYRCFVRPHFFFL